MSADKRKTILIGFAGLAVVLVAVIAIVSPSFRSEDASGAIGAVQKHRAPQITKADVVLGDEQLRNEQRVRYTDFLNDAAALRAMAENFKAASTARDSQARVESTRLGVIARQKEVSARFYDKFDDALVGMIKLDDAESLALGSKRAAIMADLDALGAQARNKSFDQKSMHDLSVRAIALAKQFNQSLDAQNMRGLAVLDHTSNLASAKKNIADAEASLNVIHLEALVRDNVAYAEAMSREAAVLAEAESLLSNSAREKLGLLVVIANEADSLDLQAAAGMKRALDNETFSYDAFGRLAHAAESANRDGSMAREVADLVSQKAHAAARVSAEAYSQLGAINTRMRSVDTLGMQLRNDFADQLGALKGLASNAKYASMINNADVLSTVNAFNLKGISNLESAKKHADTLDAAKK